MTDTTRPVAPSVKTFGWADAATIPSAEVDVSSMALREYAIQQVMDSLRDPYPKTIDRYREARRRVNENPVEYLKNLRLTDIIDQIFDFGVQASEAQRRGPEMRTVVSATGPDRVGVMAEFSAALADQGANVEGAMMSVVAGLVTSTVIVSGPDDLGALRRALGATRVLNDDISRPPIAIAMDAEPARWPRRGSSLWHLMARRGDGRGLVRTVTGVIARLDLPLLSASHWVETSESGARTTVVDVTFAISPDDPGDPAALAQAVHREIENEMIEGLVSIAPVDAPTRGHVSGTAVALNGPGVAVTVVGRARPGFVYSALSALAALIEDTPWRFIGSSMALLEGYSALTCVLETYGYEPILQDYEERVQRSMSRDGHTEPAVRFQPVQAEQVRPSATTTHEVLVQLAERRGALAEVTQVIARHRANIVWMVAYVLEPAFGGTNWPRCWMEMHVDVRKETAELLSADLRSLRENQRYERLTIDPWKADT